MESFIGMGRRPKFDLHIKIYDLNNVPLITGHSYIKWHLGHSMHAEHRGRTSKCAIANHRVDYSFSKHIPSIRISVDRSNNLSECPLEFEVLQEFAAAEKITLGILKLNLSEYIEESGAFVKDGARASGGRKRSSSTGISPSSMPGTGGDKHEVLDGITRRYLMQESKVNSTLKISILMVQQDGDKNYVAPPLRTAPVFGGIAGMMTGEPVEDEAGPAPSISKPRDTTEMQDLYRRTLAASWYRLPSELPADEAIEDIFSGGNGWKTSHHHHHHNHSSGTSTSSSTSEDDHGGGTLRPSDFRRLAARQSNHRRQHSGHSEKSATTVTGKSDTRKRWKGEERGLRRSESLASLAPTLGSGSDGAHRGAQLREVDEEEVRDDLIAWNLPNGLTA